MQPKKDMTIKEKIALIKKNIKTAYDIKKEITDLNSADKVIDLQIFDKRTPKIETHKIEEQEDQLYNQISRLSLEQLGGSFK